MQMEYRCKEEFLHIEEKELPPRSRDIRLTERTVSPRSHMENEKRIRREIANSNERRRMQSINAGFQSLRTLLPSHEGEKLSKAAILQQTAEYIYTLEQEKTRLLTQNCQLKRLLNQHEGENPPTKKRKTESQPDENTASPEPLIQGETVLDGGRRDVLELRLELDQERRLRLGLEEKLREFEANMFPDNLHLTYDTHESLSVIERNTTPLSSEIDDMGETVEEMEVPLPLIPEELEDTGIISSASLLSIASSPTVKSENEDTCETETAVLHIRRIPSVIEAPCKVEAKVEVEISPLDDPSSASCTSRQSLETIVEAIRHLEGDALFSEMASPSSPPCHRSLPVQDAPLALTTKHQIPSKLIKVDMNPFLKLHTTQSLQHQRPGVIVVKHT